LPTSAAMATTHTALRSPQLPIKSSQGLKASGSGWQDTSRGERDRLPQYAWISRGLTDTMLWWNTPSTLPGLDWNSATTRDGQDGLLHAHGHYCSGTQNLSCLRRHSNVQTRQISPQSFMC
jgi:hypothetical protein